MTVSSETVIKAMTGIITKALSGFYYVSADGKSFECKARGSFRKSGASPLVGDRVELEAIGSDSGIINKILPRKNCVVRPPVANIDKLFIVSAFASPAPNTFITDKMTAVARYNGIEPIIVFNKCDMGDFTALESVYLNAGFKIFKASALTEEGISPLENELRNCVSAFTGNSGVGKSSILNKLLGNGHIQTGEVSEKLGRGRHTTRHTELYQLPFGGFVADTPGFSVFEAERYDYAFKQALPELFTDFADFTPFCRFSGCTHTKENGCAVLEAVADGNIEKSRHDSYVRLFGELKDLKPWQTKK